MIPWEQDCTLLNGLTQILPGSQMNARTPLAVTSLQGNWYFPSSVLDNKEQTFSELMFSSINLKDHCYLTFFFPKEIHDFFDGNILHGYRKNIM